MKKISLIAITTIFAVLLFGVSSFATDNNMATDAMQGVRNVVNGTGNVVGGAVGGMTNGIRNGMSAIGNTFDMTGDEMDDDMATTDTNNGGAMTTDTNNGGYDATRTTTRTATTRAATDNGNFLGMSDTVWVWFIMTAVAIATVGLVWYYAKERENNYNHEDNY